MMRHGFLIALALAACSQPVEYPTRVVRRAVGMAAICRGSDGKPQPMDNCTGRISLFVADGDVGGIHIIDATSGAHTDADPFVPGFTSVPVGDDLIAVAASRDSSHVYALLRGPREIVQMDPTTLAISRQAIPCQAEAMEVASAGPWAGSLVVACANPSGLLRVPLADFGSLDPSSLSLVPVVGRPFRLALSGDGLAAFVTHMPQGAGSTAWLTKVDLATLAQERAGLGPECSDGLDNDNDGRVDALDPGCVGPTDDSESPDRPDMCANGDDDDGDGLLDATDPDCPVSEFSFATRPACANGLDDDGDGFTDFGEDPDCYGPLWQSEAGQPPRMPGKPAVSPDTRFVYVPVSAPDGVVVFRTAPLTRVDTNRADGPAPNPLLARIGFKDILLNAGATEVAMATGSAGTWAFAALSSGQIVRLVVDDGQSERHVVSQSSTTGRSVATEPVLTVPGESIATGSSLHSDHSSFGPAVISLVPGSTNRYDYFGIVFNGNPSVELSETWRVTYEGRIPGASGQGFFAGGAGRFVDPVARFCEAGVEPGDLLVLKPDGLCGLKSGDSIEYRVAEVLDNALVAKPITTPLPEQGCGPVRYEIRLSGAWTVVGSRSGFLHGWMASPDGHCVKRPDASPLFTARAYTSLPIEGDKVSACPPLSDAPDIAWKTFQNISFSFRLYPACVTDDQFQSRVIQEKRDTELSFSVLSGQVPDVASVGGIPTGMVIVARTLYVFDASMGALNLVDISSMTLTSRRY